MMQIQPTRAQKRIATSGDQPYQDSRGLYEMSRAAKNLLRSDSSIKLRMLVLAAVLPLISILISPVLSTDALWNIVSANTAGGQSTTMTGTAGVSNYCDLTTGAAYVFGLYNQPTAANANTFWFFSRNQGTPLSQGIIQSRNSLLVRSALVTETKIMYAGGEDAANPLRLLQVHTLSYNTGTSQYAGVSYVQTVGNPHHVVSSLFRAGAPNYLYYLRGDSTLMYRWDVTTTGLGTALGMVMTRSFGMCWYRTNFIMAWGPNIAWIQVVDSTTFPSAATTYTGAHNVNYFMVNNLNDVQIFAGKINGALAFVMVTITGTTYANTLTTTVTEAIAAKILNFGTYAYVGVQRSAPGTQFRIYSKTTLVEVVTTVFNPYSSNGYSGFSLSQGPSEGNKFFLAFQGTGNNFQSYYILFDMCVGRDSGTKICSTCPTGYYLNVAGVANNDCYEEGRGTLATTKALVPCTVTDCIWCPTDSTQCTACVTTPSKKYVLNNVCVLPPFPSGKGIDSTGNILVSCTDANCLNCAASNTVCTGCDVLGGWYLKGINCIQKPSFAVSEGVKSSDGTVATCTDAHCLKCVDDYQLCTKCDTTTAWYLDGSVCKNTPMFASNQGINSALGTVALCTDSNCIDCKTDYQTCVKCNTGAGFYLLGVSCIPPSSFTLTQGINIALGTVVTCQDANCRNCVSDYTICVTCNTAANWYLKGTVCLNKASFAPNEGAGADGKVYNCADAHCIDCRNNYLNCDKCDTVTNWYRKGTVCLLQSTLPSNEGIDSATGTVKSCSDVNCNNCNANFAVCVACATTTGWYLDGIVCKNPPLFAINQGINSVLGTVAICTDSHCVDCVNNYAVCAKCDTTTGWYLDGIVCKNTPMFATNQGISSSDGKVKNCVDLFCTNCIADYQVCKYCNPASGYFLKGVSCLSNTAFAANEGARNSDGTVQPCADAHCTNCVLDYMTCTRCDTASQWYLQGTMCKDIPSFDPGFGVNAVQGTVAVCLTNHCINCYNNYGKCLTCDTDNGWYLLGNSCLDLPQFQKNQGINNKLGTVAFCKDELCINCLNNYQICTECDQANGYIVETSNSTCKLKRLPIYLKIFQQPLIKISEVDLRYEATSLTVLDPKVQMMLYRDIQVKGVVSAIFRSRSNPGQMTSGDISLTVEAGATSAVINIKFNTYLPDKDYDVYIKSESVLNVTYEGELYTIYPAEGTFDYTNPIDKGQAETLSSTSAFMSSLASPEGSNFVSSTWALFLTLDPTGTFFRFTKILQIVNKLYFININYGKRLEAFLAKSAYAIKDDKRTQVYHSTSTRGKFTRRKVPLDMLHPYTMWKFVLYYVCWAIQAIKWLMRKNTDAGYRKWMLYFCHYANKAHLIIFNLVFIDFIWLAPRTLLHSHDLSVFRYIAALLTATLIMADCWIVLRDIVACWRWKYRMHQWSRRYVPYNSVSLDDDNDTNQPQTKQINYKKTYFEIDFNVRMTAWFDPTSTPTKHSYEELTVLYLSVGNLSRPAILMLMMLGNQYARPYGVTIFLMSEMLRFFATIYAYLKYKYLKNIICLLMEVSQSIFMIAFTSLALLISPKRFDEPVIDFYQDAGIWIVIASCVAEYLLLITYITVAAYEFIKNRNMMKKMNVKLSPVSFIKYYENGSRRSDSYSEPDQFSPDLASPSRRGFQPNPSSALLLVSPQPAGRIASNSGWNLRSTAHASGSLGNLLGINGQIQSSSVLATKIKTPLAKLRTAQFFNQRIQEAKAGHRHTNSRVKMF